jgi:hypothetical protein
LSLDYYQNFGTNGSTTVSGTLLAATTLTTGWVRYTTSVAIPSVSGKTIGSGSYLAVVFNQAVASGSQLDIWGVQLESGSVATPFTTATGTVQGELAACQRYYFRTTSNTSGQSQTPRFGEASCYSTTQGLAWVKLPQTMRTNPASLDATSLGIYPNTLSGIGITGLSLNVDWSNPNMGCLNFTVSGGSTTTQYFVSSQSPLGGYIGFGAEL